MKRPGSTFGWAAIRRRRCMGALWFGREGNGRLILLCSELSGSDGRPANLTADLGLRFLVRLNSIKRPFIADGLSTRTVAL